jgi:non-lysosomal glucosylceramidase
MDTKKNLDNQTDDVSFVQATTTLGDIEKDDANRAGVPLGGIGAGKIDLTPDGSITNITTNCNVECPICDGYASTPAKIVPGGVPGIFWALRDSSSAKVLKVHPPKGLPGVRKDQMEYEGRLPFANIKYKELGPIDVSLTAFSPLILGDLSENYKDSSIPGAAFSFALENKTENAQEYTFYYSWQNMCGCTGYYNEKYWGINDTRENKVDFKMEEEYPGAWFYSTNTSVEPRAKGNYSLRVAAPEGTKLSSRSWREATELWEQINNDIPLKADASWYEGSCGIIGVKGMLQPFSKAVIKFTVTWYFPNNHEQWHPEKNYGHMYENWFKDSWEAGAYLHKECDRLYNATKDWQDLLWESNLPEWFKYKLCDDLFPMITNSWYTKAGEFTISEAATNMGGMLGTIDQRNASQAPYLLSFPKLCRSELDLFRNRQVKAGDKNEYGFHWNFETGKPDLMINQVGAVPHDLGSESLWSYSITPATIWIAGHWPDLLSGYVLQWYAYYCWTNDPIVPKEVYESCKATIKFVSSLDFDNDGIPELWGFGSSSYDNYSFPYYGVMPYVATMFIAALAAMAKFARLMGETEYAQQLDEKKLKASATLERENWTGSYFRCWRHEGYEKWNGGEREHNYESNSIHVSQLAGQWYASMMGLGYVIDAEKVEKALETITEYNHKKIAGGAAIEYWPAENGKEAHFGECWCHYTEAYYAALAIYESQKDAGMEQLYKLWNVMNKCNARWDSGLGISGAENDVVVGRWYMTNTVSWFDLLAISGVWVNLPEKELMLAPNLPKFIGTDLKGIPIFTENFWAVIDYIKQDDITTIKMTFTKFQGPKMVFESIKTKYGFAISSDKLKLKINNVLKSNTQIVYDDVNHYLNIISPFEISQTGDKIEIQIEI